jgi:ribosomal protein S18 acetylase RimI-like enzyme
LATEEDAEQLSTLNQRFNGGGRRPAAEIEESMRTSTELIAVAEMGGKIVGFGCAQSYKSFCYRELLGEITEMYVESSVRRKGIATSLVACLERNLKARGVTEIKVLTGKRNNAAIRTYENCGYTKDDERLLKKTLVTEATDPATSQEQ